MNPDNPQPAFADRLELGEGARWVRHTNTVHLVDLDAGRLLRINADQQTLEQVLTVPTTLGAAAPIDGRPDAWLLAAGAAVVLAEPSGLTRLAELEAHNPIPTRLNDGTVDPAGRFWVTSMPISGTEPVGALHRLAPSGRLETVLDGLGIVNGPAFTADGTVMYVADTSGRRILHCGVDPSSGTLRESELFVQFDHEGPGPDGMTVDGENHLWVAMWGGSCVHRIDPQGIIQRTIRLPARQPTSVCLIPAESGSRLLITTATAGLSDPGEADGAVYAIPVPATAVPMPLARWP